MIIVKLRLFICDHCVYPLASFERTVVCTRCSRAMRSVKVKE